MKRFLIDGIFFSALIVALAVAGPAWGGAASPGAEAGSAEKMKKEVAEALDAIAGYSAEQKEEAVRKAKSALNAMDAQINVLEERLVKSYDRMSESARKEARDTLRKLRKERTRLAEWYGAVQLGAADAWQEIKEGFVEGYRSLQKSVNRAERELP